MACVKVGSRILPFSLVLWHGASRDCFDRQGFLSCVLSREKRGGGRGSTKKSFFCDKPCLPYMPRGGLPPLSFPFSDCHTNTAYVYLRRQEDAFKCNSYEKEKVFFEMLLYNDSVLPLFIKIECCSLDNNGSPTYAQWRKKSLPRQTDTYLLYYSSGRYVKHNGDTPAATTARKGKRRSIPCLPLHSADIVIYPMQGGRPLPWPLWGSPPPASCRDGTKKRVWAGEAREGPRAAKLWRQLPNSHGGGGIPA